MQHCRDLRHEPAPAEQTNECSRLQNEERLEGQVHVRVQLVAVKKAHGVPHPAAVVRKLQVRDHREAEQNTEQKHHVLKQRVLIEYRSKAGQGVQRHMFGLSSFELLLGRFELCDEFTAWKGSPLG